MTIPAGPDELTATWLETALRRDGAFPGARVRSIASQVIGVGFGLDGTLARVKLQGDGVPATLVVKWCSTASAARETSFYRQMAPRLPLTLARLHASQIDEAGGRAALVLSDVAPAKQGDVLAGATLAEAEAWVDALASFHAVYWGASAPELAPLRRFGEDGEVRARAVEAALPRFLAEWRERVAPRAVALAAELPDRTRAAYATLFAGPATLVHTDLHFDNVLLLPSGTPVILDWTDIARGPGAVDLARVFVDGLTSPMRRVHQEALTRRYADALAARGVTDYGVERVRSDLSAVFTICFASMVRWAGGPDPLPDVPRVPVVVDVIMRQTADAFAESAR